MKGVRDALSRLSGVASVIVKLQDGIVTATIDGPVRPGTIWREIERVGFKPVEMWVELGESSPLGPPGRHRMTPD